VRLRLATLVRLAVAVGLTAWLLWRTDLASVGAAFARTSWAWVAAACLLVVVDRFLMAWRWIALLSVLETRRPPIASLLRTFFVSTFLGTFLVQTVGSDAIRTISLSRDGVPASESLASVLMDRVLGILSLLIAAAVGVALVPRVIGQPGVIWPFAIASAGCAVAVAFVFSTRVDDAVRGWLGHRPAGRLSRIAERLLDALQAYRRRHGMLTAVLLASLAVQGLRIWQAWCLGRGLGLTLPFSSYLAFIPLILLIMLLPITFNGLGTSQLAFVWAFRQVGVADADALTLSVLFVALGIVGNLPGGVLVATGGAPARAS
jgi:glycosyltransferase 2 family protein